VLLICFCFSFFAKWQKCEAALHKPIVFHRLTVALDSRILSALQLWHFPRMRRRRLVAAGHDFPFPCRRWKLWHARAAVLVFLFFINGFYFNFFVKPGRAAWVWLAVGLGLQMNAALVCGIHWPERMSKADCEKMPAKSNYGNSDCNAHSNPHWNGLSRWEKLTLERKH